MPGQSLPSCEGCRRRKTKCDHRAECSGCVMRGEPCIYRNGPPRLPAAQSQAEASTSSTPSLQRSSPRNQLQSNGVNFEEEYYCLRSVVDNLADQIGMSPAQVEKLIHRTRRSRRGPPHPMSDDHDADELSSADEAEIKRAGSLPPLADLPDFPSEIEPTLQAQGQPLQRPLAAPRSYSQSNGLVFANTGQRFDFGLDARPSYLSSLQPDLWQRQGSEGASSVNSFERGTAFVPIYSDSAVRTETVA